MLAIAGDVLIIIPREDESDNKEGFHNGEADADIHQRLTGVS